MLNNKRTLFFLVLTSMLIVSLVASTFMISAASNTKLKYNEDELTKTTFIHYKDGKVRAIDSKVVSAVNTCYKLMGVKWSTIPVSYVINPTNPEGLSESFVTSTISTSAETWDSATSKELFNNAFTTDNTVSYGVYDGKNAIVFGDYPNNNVIAVTSVWYTIVGKRIVEFDIEFNTRFQWGDASVNPLLMDLQNIATHELGHGVGMADIYTAKCSAVTMYGYASNGETQKRTLEAQDIKGLQLIYGR